MRAPQRTYAARGNLVFASGLAAAWTTEVIVTFSDKAHVEVPKGTPTSHAVAVEMLGFADAYRTGLAIAALQRIKIKG